MVSAAVLQALTPNPAPPLYPVEFWVTDNEGGRVARVDRLVHRGGAFWEAFAADRRVGQVEHPDLATSLLRCGYRLASNGVLLYEPGSVAGEVSIVPIMPGSFSRVWS